MAQRIFYKEVDRSSVSLIFFKQRVIMIPIILWSIHQERAHGAQTWNDNRQGAISSSPFNYPRLDCKQFSKSIRNHDSLSGRRSTASSLKLGDATSRVDPGHQAGNASQSLSRGSIKHRGDVCTTMVGLCYLIY